MSGQWLSITIALIVSPLICPSITAIDSEVTEHTLTLTGPESALGFGPIKWDLSDSGNANRLRQLVVSIRFRTFSRDGQLIHIIGRNESVNIKAKIYDSAVSVRFVDEISETLHKDRLIEAANNGNEFSLAFELYPSINETGFAIRLATDRQARFVLPRKITLQSSLDVFVNIGRTEDEPSMIGCITFLRPYINGEVSEATRMHHGSRNGWHFGCKDACDGVECGPAQCINDYVKGRCDCLGTKTYGDSCKTESKAVHLRWNQFLAYELDDSLNGQPLRIAFSFRLAKGVTDALLLHAPMTSLKNTYTGQLKLVLVDSTITLQLTNVTSIVFKDFPTEMEIFHRVLLTFNYAHNRLAIAINDDIRQTEWHLHDGEQIRFVKLINFGGSGTTGDLGMDGCMNEMFVDFESVIMHYRDRTDKVKINVNEAGDCKPTASAAIYPPVMRISGVGGGFGSNGRDGDRRVIVNDQLNDDHRKNAENDRQSDNQDVKAVNLETDDTNDEKRPMIIAVNPNQRPDNLQDQEEDTYGTPTGRPIAPPPPAVETEKPDVDNEDELRPLPQLPKDHEETEKPPMPIPIGSGSNRTAITLEEIEKLNLVETLIGDGAEPRVTPCEQSVAAMRCRNGAACEMHRGPGSEDPTQICVCRPQYTGTSCQFCSRQRPLLARATSIQFLPASATISFLLPLTMRATADNETFERNATSFLMDDFSAALPRTCHHALAMGNHEPGVYELDLDGSGPLLPTFAECIDGATLVSHNMPNETVGRSQQYDYDIQMPIHYKLFTPEQLRLLQTESATCQQYVRYDCKNAPLRFSYRQTWFETMRKPVVAQIGPYPDFCMCGSAQNCVGQMKCHCDSKRTAMDDGYLTGDSAGVIGIYVMHEGNENGEGRFSLGPLNCTGDAHTSTEISFINTQAFLITEPWRNGNFEFEFRTSQERSQLLTAETAESTNMRLELKEGHFVRIQYTAPDGSMKSLQVISQKRLNDTKWHRISVEILHDELRLTVDSTNAFLIVNKELDPVRNAPLIFSRNPTADDSDNGFVGCMRALRIDGRKIDLTSLVDRVGNRSTGIRIGCQTRCDESRCKQDAECVDDFEHHAYQCICKNPHIHAGAHCDENINDDSEVSFHDLQHGFLSYKDTKRNPLTETVVFGFRTDQPNALLMYAHDQHNNFIQVHLYDEMKIVLTLNNDITAYQCTINATIGQEFSDMEWLQIVILHTDEHTALLVDDQMCVIKGRRSLSEVTIDKFYDDHLMTVFPPRLPVSFHDDSYKFTLLYIGGVPRYQGARAFFRRFKRSLNSFYGTNLPPILGYMRGVRIGDETVDLRNGGTRPPNDASIRVGWDSECEDLRCENGGHCTVRWRDDGSAKSDVRLPRASCDCSKTSYFGSQCNEDRGLQFPGWSTLSFDLVELFKRMVLPGAARREPESLNFAFAAIPRDAERHSREYLLVLQLEHDRRFEVILNRNGSLNAALILTDDDVEIHTFRGNFTDGYRHFIMLTFNDPRGMSITLDSERYRFTNIHANQTTLEKAQRLYFAGDGDTNEKAMESSPVPVAEKKNSRDAVTFYRGCISNIELDFHVGDKSQFRPILYYRETGSPYERYVKTIPPEATLDVGQCATFRIPGALPVLQRNVQFPEWGNPFRLMKYERPPEPEPVSEGLPLWAIILLILLLLLIITLVIVACCFMKIRHRRHHKETNGRPIADRPSSSIDYETPPAPYKPYSLYGDPSADVHETAPLTFTGPSTWQTRPNTSIPPSNFDDLVPTNLVLPQANRPLDRPTSIPTVTSPMSDISEPENEAEAENVSYRTTPGSSVGSDTTAYYTANDHLSNRSLSSTDLDSTIKDYDEDETLIPERGELSENRFDRMPTQRVSSFRDPSAPAGSPLNRTPSDRRPQPKYVPPPKSPIPRI